MRALWDAKLRDSTRLQAVVGMSGRFVQRVPTTILVKYLLVRQAKWIVCIPTKAEIGGKREEEA
jgi:hypothetical protein